MTKAVAEVKGVNPPLLRMASTEPAEVRAVLRTANGPFSAAYALAPTINAARWREVAFKTWSPGYLDARGPNERMAADVREVLAKLPEPETLTAWSDVLAPTAAAGFDERATRLVVGLMLDGFPSGRPGSPTVYLEWLIHEAEAEGWSPHVIAPACRKLVREKTFLPSPAEFVEAAQEVAGAINGARRMVDRAVELRAEGARYLERMAALNNLLEQSQ